MEPIEFEKRVAECVGLWLAEGSTTSKSEITFTNNCLDLVNLFHDTINALFEEYTYNQRVYVYSKDSSEVKLPYKNCIYKYYTHKRATKPYFIIRIASVDLIKKWNEIIREKLSRKEFYPFILRGFFAGEGNVKEGKRSVRVLRISQAVQKEFIDNLLRELNITYNFTSSNRMYNVSSKTNWDIFAKYKLADLHPAKKERFWRLYNSYTEVHYKNNYLYQEVLKALKEPLTTRQLSEKFNRSFARIQDIVILLKKEKKIKNFRIGSKNFWTNNNELIMISKIKQKYLNILEQPKTSAEIAKEFKVGWKSSFRRLSELKKLNVVQFNEDKKWQRTNPNKKIIVI
jgi:hypothetical protein